MPYTASDLRKGLKLRYEGQPYTITEYSFTKPGKGQSIYTCRLKHMLTGNTFVKNCCKQNKYDIDSCHNSHISDVLNYCFFF